jgi:NAD(P)-dependent dehydrogenase (short-subunit alcohol dehydrogenase family)
VQADVSQETGVKDMVDEVCTAFDRVDVLVNNTVVTLAKSWQDLPTDD